MTKTVLVLGATGGVGGETARALLAHGWQVRGLARTLPREPSPIEWRQGDAMDEAAVGEAAAGCAVIVHAVNPPGYRDWDRLVLPMIDNSIAAARAQGARLVLPGTIYNYDPQETPVARPDSPQRPTTRKGEIRVELERRMQASGMKSLILRCGDFFSTHAGNSWLSQGMVTPGKPVRRIVNPASPGVGHAWAYLPDVAETFARLLDREGELAPFARHHFAGFYDSDGQGMVRAIREAAGNPRIPVSRLPWALLPALGLFNPTIAETAKMRTFWRHPLALDNASLEAAIGPEPRTPLVAAMRAALQGLGCL